MATVEMKVHMLLRAKITCRPLFSRLLSTVCAKASAAQGSGIFGTSAQPGRSRNDTSTLCLIHFPIASRTFSCELSSYYFSGPWSLDAFNPSFTSRTPSLPSSSLLHLYEQNLGHNPDPVSQLLNLRRYTASPPSATSRNIRDTFSDSFLPLQHH